MPLCVPGAGALGLLGEIRKAVFRQRIGEEPEELLTLDGTTVSRSALAAGFDGPVLDLQKKPVPAAAFAAFFEGREHDPAALHRRMAGESAGKPSRPI